MLLGIQLLFIDAWLQVGWRARDIMSYSPRVYAGHDQNAELQSRASLA